MTELKSAIITRLNYVSEDKLREIYRIITVDSDFELEATSLTLDELDDDEREAVAKALRYAASGELTDFETVLTV